MTVELLQTALLGEWVISTRTTVDKYGTKFISGKRYPVPIEVIKEIVFDFLFKEAEGYKLGYKFDLRNKRTGEMFKVTVERIPKEVE